VRPSWPVRQRMYHPSGTWESGRVMLKLYVTAAARGSGETYIAFIKYDEMYQEYVFSLAGELSK
jgi:hypothetical protein